MRVPGKRMVTQRAPGLRQDYRESNEREGLPKLRRFVPNEQTQETAPCGGEEGTNGTLLRIVTQGSQFCCEIKRHSENGKRQQPQAHMNVLCGLKMQIDDNAA